MLDIVQKCSVARKLYRDRGPRHLLNETWSHLILKSPLAPYLRATLGETRQQQLLAYLLVGYWPDVREPRSFNEKVIHRKLFTDNEQFAVVENKWRVREYVRERVGDEVLPEVYHVTDDPATIPFDELPDEFVIKPSHTSGSVLIFDEGDPLDETAVRQRCRDWLSQGQFDNKLEYWYDDIEPRIIVEERLRDDHHDVPPDFKFFVFHGRVEYIEVDFDRFSGHTRRFYDQEWTPQEFTQKFPMAPEVEEPKLLDSMIDIAETLGSEFDFIRVDLYQLNDERIVFGELTVAHASGMGAFDPQWYDFELGHLW
jgi:hypothetical protein